VLSANVDIPAGPPHIQAFQWDPGGAAGDEAVLLVIADQDVDGRRIEPPEFGTPAAVDAFAAARPSVAIRRFDIVGP
jgi:hypothetical protein